MRFKIVWKDFSDHSPQSAPLHCLSYISAALPLLRSSHFGRFSPQLLRLIRIPEKTTPCHWEHPHLSNSKRVFGEVQWHLCLWPLKQALPPLLTPMNLLQQLLSSLHWLQASDKASLNSYSNLNKQGPFIYPFGGTIFSNSHNLHSVLMEPFLLRVLKENTVMKISFTKVPESQQMNLARWHSKE